MRKLALNFIFLIINVLFFLLWTEEGQQKKDFFFALVFGGYAILRFIWTWWHSFKKRIFTSAAFYSVISAVLLYVFAQSLLTSSDLPVGFYLFSIFFWAISLSHIHLADFFLTNKAISFSKHTLFSYWSLLFSILLFSSTVLVGVYDQKAFSVQLFTTNLPTLLVGNISLPIVLLLIAEKKLKRKQTTIDTQPFIEGKPMDSFEFGFFEKLQSIKTIAFAKKNILTDGKDILQDVNHRSTMREQTVLNVLFQLFNHLNPKIASAIEEKLETVAEIEFEHIEVKNDAVFATDDFGVEYILGSYEVAKKLTQDKSYSYYLTRGRTLYAKLRFADSIIADQKILTKVFNQRPTNTVLISDESFVKCKSVAENFNLDKTYPSLSPIAQTEIIEKLKAKAPTAYIGKDEPVAKSASIGFCVKKKSPVEASANIWKLFSYAKTFRNTSRSTSYFLMMSSLVFATLSLVWKFEPLPAFLVPLAIQAVTVIYLPARILKHAETNYQAECITNKHSKTL